MEDTSSLAATTPLSKFGICVRDTSFTLSMATKVPHLQPHSLLAEITSPLEAVMQLSWSGRATLTRTNRSSLKTSEPRLENTMQFLKLLLQSLQPETPPLRRVEMPLQQNLFIKTPNHLSQTTNTKLTAVQVSEVVVKSWLRPWKKL